MSKKSIQNIVDDTCSAIFTNLSALGTPVNERHIKGAFKAPIEAAYLALKTADESFTTSQSSMDAARRKLFLQLSLAFHPDKLTTNPSDFAIKFRELSTHDNNLYSIPQQVLFEIKTKTETTTETETDKNLINPETTVEYLDRLTAEYLTQLRTKLERYPQPIRSFTLFVQYCFIVPARLSKVMSIAPLILGSALTSIFESSARQFLRILGLENSLYGDIEKYITDEALNNRARHHLEEAGFNVESEQNILKLFLNIMVPETIEETPLNRSIKQANVELALKAEIRNEIQNERENNVTVMSFLTEVFNSLISALSAPLPNGWVSIMMHILFRLVQATLVVPLLSIIAASQLLTHASNLLSMGIVAVVTAFSAVILETLNLPIYIYDGLCKISQWVSGDSPKTTSSEPTPPTSPDEPNVTSSYGLMLIDNDYDKPQSIPAVAEEKTDEKQSNPFGLFAAPSESDLVNTKTEPAAFIPDTITPSPLSQSYP